MKYTAGIEFCEGADIFITYPIDFEDGDDLHDSKIVVYDDEALRDKIVEFLNNEEK